MLLQQLSLGGPVMLPMLILSISVVTIGVDRFSFWRKIGTASAPRWRRLEEELAGGKPLSPVSLGSPVASLLQRLGNADGEANRQLVLQLTLQQERQRMARGERVLEASAALGPLLGLLGTVTGLMRTFTSLGHQGDIANAASLAAAGIAEVLVATAMGILLALLAMVVLRVNAAYRTSQLALLERVALAYELNQSRQVGPHG